MTRFELGAHLVLYQFPHRPQRHVGANVYALLDERAKAAMLIDTAYEEQARVVVCDLGERGYRVTAALISHFHEDHIVGLRALPGVRVVGSPHAGQLLAAWPDAKERVRFAPAQEVGEGTRLRFGDTVLRFECAPGHAPCSLHTWIGEDFLHVGDNLIASNEGEPVLPFVYDAPAHVASLEQIVAHCDRTLLLGHGKPIPPVTAVAEVELRLS